MTPVTTAATARRIAPALCSLFVAGLVAGCQGSSPLTADGSSSSDAGTTSVGGAPGTAGGGGTVGAAGAAGGGGTAGAAGAAGGGGTAGAAGAADVEGVGTAPSCGPINGGDPSLSISTTLSAAAPYEGNALVTSSDANQLVLELLDSNAPADAAAAEARIDGHPAPSLPLGAKVWFSYTGNASLPRAPQPWTFTVSVRQGGIILFGAASKAPNDASGPIAVGAEFPSAT